MRKAIVGAAIVSASIGCGGALAADPDISQLNPNVMKYVLPDKINWQAGQGVDTAFLQQRSPRPARSADDRAAVVLQPTGCT